MLPPLTKEQILENLEYDKERGQFLWHARRDASGRRRAKLEARTVNSDGYVRVPINGKNYLEHFLVLFMETGVWPKQGKIAWRNGRSTDNRICNLFHK